MEERESEKNERRSLVLERRLRTLKSTVEPKADS